MIGAAGWGAYPVAVQAVGVPVFLNKGFDFFARSSACAWENMTPC